MASTVEQLAPLLSEVVGLYFPSYSAVSRSRVSTLPAFVWHLP
jgi:hypothetical protein